MYMDFVPQNNYIPFLFLIPLFKCTKQSQSKCLICATKRDFPNKCRWGIRLDTLFCSLGNLKVFHFLLL